MARSRNIKPSIMDNEELADLEPLTRLLFVYLWMLADREGRLEDRPKRIAAQALPYDRAADVGAMLDDLHKAGFIERYTAGGVSCILILSFTKHQAPHGTERDSTLPDADGMFTVHSRGKNGYSTGETQLVDSLLTVKKLSVNTLIPDSLIPDSLIPDSGESAAPKPRATKKCPVSFTITKELADWAIEKAPAVDIQKATDKFRDHTFRNAITDWDGAWRNWMRKDQEAAQERGNRPSRSNAQANTINELTGGLASVKEPRHALAIAR